MRTNFIRSAVVLVLVTAASPLFAETAWLSSLDLKQMTSGWSVPKANLDIAGKAITIGGQQFTNGVGTHAASTFRVDLAGKAKRFFARVGLDDTAEGKGSVEFIVAGDGKVLWQSGLLLGGKPALPVDVDVTGVRVLALRVTDGGDGATSDHADWAEAGIEIDTRIKIMLMTIINSIRVKPRSCLFLRLAITRV